MWGIFSRKQKKKKARPKRRKPAYKRPAEAVSQDNLKPIVEELQRLRRQYNNLEGAIREGFNGVMSAMPTNQSQVSGYEKARIKKAIADELRAGKGLKEIHLNHPELYVQEVPS